MTQPVHHPGETSSNEYRDLLAAYETRSQRTYTPTQAVLAASAGIYHWTPEGRRLYDFTSGVLVANLGHNPRSWLKRLQTYLRWDLSAMPFRDGKLNAYSSPRFLSALPLSAYNAVTPVELDATRRLVELLQSRPGGNRLEQVLWAASGSEAIQKALWAALARDKNRQVIVATRYGFHGKKGLAGAVTGCETDHDRDPRVKFISFPMEECRDISQRDQPFDPTPYRRELEALTNSLKGRIATLITEPYLGGGGSFHPPRRYLQLLQEFCRAQDIVFILDEVQSNFGRTGDYFAFETYGIEPDIVVLGKGLANGVPVAAAVGRADILASLDYGEGSDTWSGNPLCCAGVLATLDEFAEHDILSSSRKSSEVIEKGLIRLKELPFIAKVRGEKGGMVWGVETQEHAGKSAKEWAQQIVLDCYLGNNGSGIHLLGPLSQKVIRIAPPLVISKEEAQEAMNLMHEIVNSSAAARTPA